MSPNVRALVLSGLALLSVAAESAAACSPESQALLQQSTLQVLAAEYAGAAEALRVGYNAERGCVDLMTAAWSWHGWLAATRASKQGGTTESLKPVGEALAALELSGRTVASLAEYAGAAVHAAAAASQDERDEMRVWMDHARGVASRLALTGVEASWPLPPDLIEGELWLEVDDFEAARASFMRALAAGETAAGLRGLARARLRLGDAAGGCAAYQRAQALVAATYPNGVVATEAASLQPRCGR